MLIDWKIECLRLILIRQEIFQILPIPQPQIEVNFHKKNSIFVYEINCMHIY